jgi:hypothetical protein
MKLVKMSLAAALLVSGAYALDNVKVNGSAKLIYQTTDTDNTAATTDDTSLFSKAGANGQVSVKLGATADLVDNISAGVEFQALSTLGLENQLVDNVMEGSQGVQDAWNASQLWMAASYGKTTVKLGRMELDTPLAFTEKWNMVNNTFEAAVAINQDLADTTLVAAYVGGSNGVIGSGSVANLGGNNAGVATESGFGQFYGGAYAVAAIYSGLENTTLQAWYYNIADQSGSGTVNPIGNGKSNIAATAYWLQADTKLVDMIDLGVQYTSMSLDKLNNGTLNVDDIDAWAIRVAGDVASVNLYAAYSNVGSARGNVLAVANVDTQDKTKLYTGSGSIYHDGAVVGLEDTTTWKIGAKTTLGEYKVGASYAQSTQDNDALDTTTTTTDIDYNTWDAFVATKVGAIDLKAIYTNYDRDVAGTSTKGVIGTMTADHERDTIRIIASVKF